VQNPYEYTVANLDTIDFQALVKLARPSFNILEFGTGGSTLLFAQFAPPRAHVWTVDTDPKWQDRTADNLDKLGTGLRDRVDFLKHESWKKDLHERVGPLPWFDLIFVDGKMEDRAKFAEDAWPLLMPTGVMAYHDCRWQNVVHMAAQLMVNEYLEIEKIELGMQNSNVLAIHKKPLMHAPCPPPPPLEKWMTGVEFLPPPPSWPTKRLVP
jgi:predicted O-methyltransferase YrrM